MKTADKIMPTVFAIFGGSGDLTWRKLMPSLFNLLLQKNLPNHFSKLKICESVSGKE
jgi:glucose-6-phosphate 1-dehydrogenase